ncbi:MAG: HemK2/MTQ2 family protein methyltransferase [Candidatus Nanoarchaeia archaeon]|jgi:release factor glutamine methyltransferase
MVYSPREDSYLLKKYVANYCKGKKVLDMGTGSGIQAIAAKAGGAARVLGVDKNKKAVILAKKNAKLAGFADIEFKFSDLFLAVNEKFDLIVFNPPYLPNEEHLDISKDYDLIGGEKGNEVSIEFLKQAKEYLNPKGCVLIICSSISDPFEIFSYAESFGYSYEILEEFRLDFETLYCVKLWVKE